MFCQPLKINGGMTLLLAIVTFYMVSNRARDSILPVKTGALPRNTSETSTSLELHALEKEIARLRITSTQSNRDELQKRRSSQLGFTRRSLAGISLFTSNSMSENLAKGLKLTPEQKGRVEGEIEILYEHVRNLYLNSAHRHSDIEFSIPRLSQEKDFLLRKLDTNLDQFLPNETSGTIVALMESSSNFISDLDSEISIVVNEYENTIKYEARDISGGVNQIELNLDGSGLAESRRKLPLFAGIVAVNREK